MTYRTVAAAALPLLAGLVAACWEVQHGFDGQPDRHGRALAYIAVAVALYPVALYATARGVGWVLDGFMGPRA